mgnify:FL=1
MRNVRQIITLSILAVGVLTSRGSALDWGRVGKALVFPGMGHLGDDQTVKGLTYMGTEVVLLTAMFENLSQISSHALETHRLNVLYKMGGPFEEMRKIQKEWVDADEKYDSARLYSWAFGGAALAWWGWTVVDAALFPPSTDSEARLLIDEAMDHMRLAVEPGGRVRLAYMVAF